MTLNGNKLDNILINRQKIIEPTPSLDSVIYGHGKDGMSKEDRYLQFGTPRIPDTRLIIKNNWESILSQRQTLVTISILLLLGLIFGSWGTVYAAQDSLPNETLYSIKLIRENFQLSFTSDKRDRISLLTIIANRRVEEAAALDLQGEPIPVELPALMDEYLEELAMLSADLEEATSLGAITGI